MPQSGKYGSGGGGSPQGLPPTRPFLPHSPPRKGWVMSDRGCWTSHPMPFSAGKPSPLGMAHSRNGWVNLGIVIALSVLFVPPGQGIHFKAHVLDTKETASVLLKHAPQAPPTKRTGSRPVTGSPYVKDTLVLWNNTLVPGNFLASEFVYPSGASYDTGRGEVFVTGLDCQSQACPSQVQGTVSVISDANETVVATVPVGSYPESVTYDNAKGEMFVVNSNNCPGNCYGPGSVSVVSDVNNTVVATVKTGSDPYGVAYDSGKGEIFVANSGAGDNNVSVISDANNTVVATVPVGSQPYGVAYDSGKGEVFVTNQNSGNVSVISDSSNTVVATVKVGSDPHGVVYDSGDGDVYVTNYATNNVSVISDTSNTVVATINVGGYPISAIYDSGQGEVFVANWQSGTVSVIADASNTVVNTFTAGVNPVGMSYDRGRKEVFVTTTYAVNIVSDATNTVVGAVQVESNPEGVGYDGGNGDVYVTNDRTNNVSAISDVADSVVRSVPVGTHPEGVCYDSSKGEVFVANYDSNTVTVISDANDSVVATVRVGSGPSAIEYDSGRGEVFVANVGSSNVSVISDVDDKVVATISAGGSFIANVALGYDSGKGEVFVTDASSNLVSVIDDATNTIVANITVGSSPDAVAYDSGKGEVFVASWEQGLVSVISDANNTVVATIIVQSEPQSETYDSSTGDIFVANSGGGSVSVIADANNAVVATIAVGSGPVGVAHDAGRGYVYVSNSLQGTVSILSDGSPSSGPAISSFTTSPTTVSVGQTAILAVAASGGTGALSYAYAGLPAGCVTSNVSSLTCTPSTAGSYTVRVYVNDTAGHSANATTPLIVTSSTSPALSSVSLSPSSDTLHEGTSTNFSASPSCTGGSCPTSGTVFSWSLTNSLGTLSTTSGATLTFTAGPTAGTDTLFVNATLNGVTKETSAVITISATPVPTLSSVSMSPSSPSVVAEGTQSFTATPSCSGGMCPAGTTYKWSLNNSLGTLSSTTGSSTVFTAESKAGTVTLAVEATLNDKSAWSNATITIQAKSQGVTGFLGLPSYEGYILIGVAVAVVVAALVTTLLLRKRKGVQPTPLPPAAHPVSAVQSPSVAQPPAGLPLQN